MVRHTAKLSKNNNYRTQSSTQAIPASNQRTQVKQKQSLQSSPAANQTFRRRSDWALASGKGDDDGDDAPSATDRTEPNERLQRFSHNSEWGLLCSARTCMTVFSSRQAAVL